MATTQNADSSLLNLKVRDTIVCQGTITTNEIKAITAEFDFLHVRDRAILPPVPPTPPPIPPNPRGSLMVDGNLTVSGTSTLIGNTSIGGTLDVTGATTLTNLTVTGNETVDLKVLGPTTLSNLTVTGNETVDGNLRVNGLSYVGPATSMDQRVYVSKAGNDTTGDGRIATPFLTIQRAMTAITDAAQTKQYGVVVGPGVYDDNFAFKPWVGLSGAPSSSAFQGITTIGNATITFDPTWLGITYDVAWFSHLTFNNAVPFDIQNVNAQLTFFDCTFNNGSSYVGHHSGNVNNITWDCCLSYGVVSVTDCQFFFLIGGTSILGSSVVTLTATNAVGPATATQLLALGGSISPGIALVSGAGSDGAIGDMRGCGVITSLSLNSTGGAPISYTSTVEGFPSSISFLGTANVTNLHYYTFSNALAYTPTNLANWSGVSPVNVQNALDRIAAKITPIP